MELFSLEDTFARRAPFTRRWTYLYLIKEYARHRGTRTCCASGWTR